MRVLFDGRPIRNPMSGVARYCLNLSNGITNLLREEDHITVDVFCQNWRKSNSTFESVRKTSNASFSCQKNIPPKFANLAFEFCPSLAKQFYNGPYDIIHETYFANLGSKKSEKKIVTVHDLIPIEFPHFFNKRNSYFSKKNFFRQCTEADHIICVSEYTKSKILEYADFDKPITVLPCGVEAAPTTAIPTNTRKLEHLLNDESLINILYVGNIEPRKNLITLAKAVAKLNSTNNRYRLIIAGYSNFQAHKIITSIQSILDDKTVYLGAVSDIEKWWLLKNADLFVLPSLYEGFGIPVIEAYSAGCLPVFSNCSSLTELAVSDKQLFDPKSISNIAEVISHAIDNKRLHGEIQAKADLKMPLYNWENISARVRDIYQTFR